MEQGTSWGPWFTQSHAGEQTIATQWDTEKQGKKQSRVQGCASVKAAKISGVTNITGMLGRLNSDVLLLLADIWITSSPDRM